MSLPELLNATKQHLCIVNGAAWEEDKNVFLSFDGKVPLKSVGFRDFAVGIGCASWEPGDTNETNPGLHEILGIQCTITKKITNLPVSSLNDVTYDVIRGVYAIARKVMLAVHDSWTLLGYANAHLAGDSFITTPKWRYTSPQPRLEGPEWLYAEGQGNAGSTCLVVDVKFGGVERIQCSTQTPGVY